MTPIHATLVPGQLVLRQGDCLEALRQWPDSSVNAIVCDPPYGMSENPPPIADVLRAWLADEEYVHRGGGIKKNEWDAWVPGPSTWKECLRVLKPGGYLIAFSGARTAYALTVAVDLAGFEIRNTLAWIHADGGGAYNHNIDQRFEKLITTGRSARPPGIKPEGKQWIKKTGGGVELTQPEAIAWKGWGTGLKPAQEPILMARKPMIGSYVENLREHGTGALNIDGCRVDDGTMARHPANVIHDGSDEALYGFPDDKAGFYFCAKPRGAERGDNDHDTIKPVALMRWLCRLVTPPGGIIVDPFAGSGTTGAALVAEGFRGMLIERETKYCEQILNRFSGPPEKDEAKMQATPVDLAAVNAEPALVPLKTTKVENAATKVFKDAIRRGQMDLLKPTSENT